MFWRQVESGVIPFDPRQDAYPAPGVGIFDAPLVGRPINSAWASFIDGVVSRLDQYDMWTGSADDQENATVQIREYLISLGNPAQDPGDAMFKLRQNIDDPFLLEQSIDGGNTWTFAFDYSILDRQSTSITKINQLAQFIAQTNNVTLSPTFISNFVSVQTFTGDANDTPARIQRNRDSLCALVNLIVNVTSDALVQYVDESTTVVDLIEDASAAIIGSAITIFGLAGGAVGAIAGTIAGAFVSYIVSEAQNIAVTPFRDAAIRENVACAIYKQLSNVPATRESLVSGISAAGACLTTQENIVRVFVQLLFSIPGLGDIAFNDLMRLLGDARAVDLFGSCTCAESGTWRYTLYFTDAQAMNRNRAQVIDGAWAVKGLQATTPASGGRYSARLTTAFSIPAGSTIDFAAILIDSDGNYDSMIALNRWNGILTQQNCACFGDAYLAEKVTLGDGQFFVDQQVTMSTSAAPGYIAGIAMTGTGANPFAACDNW